MSTHFISAERWREAADLLVWLSSPERRSRPWAVLPSARSYCPPETRRL